MLVLSLALTALLLHGDTVAGTQLVQDLHRLVDLVGVTQFGGLVDLTIHFRRVDVNENGQHLLNLHRVALLVGIRSVDEDHLHRRRARLLARLHLLLHQHLRRHLVVWVHRHLV